MYANLAVQLKDGTQLPAWQVTFPANGQVLVHLDKADGGGSYAEPAGLRSFAPSQIECISADF